MKTYLGIFNVDGNRRNRYFNAANDKKAKDEAEFCREELAKDEKKKLKKVVLFGIFRVIWKNRKIDDFVLKEVK